MTEQGTIYIQGWSNGVQELSDFSDIYVSCKYGWKDTSLGNVTQTGTITNKSLTVSDTFDFITFEGDSHTITATWDDEQYIGVVPVIYDVILTYSGSSPKLNKLSFDPTNDGWTVIGDCETVDQGINSGYAIEFSNPQKEIHVETQTDKKAWSTTEPYFGTGVIADGAYYDETENTYIVIDGTNHPGQLSFSSTTSWEPANTRNYSKQTSGSMFYTWDYNSITECSGHNRYTWDLSDVYLCYDNTTTLTVDGITYTKQNPGPTEPDLTFNWYVINDATEGFHFISSNLVQWDMCDHESTSDITLNWIEGTAIGNYGPWYFADGSSKYYYNATDNTLGDSYEDGPIENVYTYSASGLSCGTPEPPYSVEIITSGQGTVDGIHSGDQTGQYYLTAIPAQGWVFDHWTISGWDTQDNPLDTSFPDAHQTVYVYFVQEGPGPQPTEKHIYLCDNSGAHLAEMSNTGSTWSVTGSFTSGMYSVRATVEGEYNDAWFKFYQTQGDNRIFVGAGDDPSFEDIGTYIMIDDILVSFSLVEDQTTGYYVVTYQNTAAMTTSMVDTIVNSYIGDFVTSSDISAMGYMTQTDISSMSYITMTDVQALGYLTQTDIDNMSYITMTDIDNCSYATESYVMEKISEIQPGGDTSVCVKYTDLNNYAYISATDLNSMSYVDQTSLSSMSYVDITSLSSMSYVDNSYLSTYINNVVGDINAILQTI